MNCLRPISVKYKDFLGYDRYIDAPCGKCFHCRKNRQNDWSVRLFEESKDWLFIDFVTFTYNDKSLPVNCELDYATGELRKLSTLRMSDLSGAFKRFRTRYERQFGEKIEMRYFFCGEYGSLGSQRPHYHALIFYNCDPRRLNILYSDWEEKYGYTCVKNVGNSRADKQKVSIYVSKYLTKTFFCSRQQDIDDCLIERPRYVMSKGIGEGYLKRMKSYHTDCDIYTMVDRMFYSFGDKYRYQLPRYYKDRLYHKKEFIPLVDYEYTFENLYQVAEVRSAKFVARFTCQNYLSFAIADIVRKRSIARFYKEVRSLQSAFDLALPAAISSKVLADRAVYQRSSRNTWLSMAQFANKNHFSRHSSS